MGINWQWLYLLYQLEKDLKLKKLSACKGQSKKLKILLGTTLNSRKGVYIGGQIEFVALQRVFKNI